MTLLSKSRFAKAHGPTVGGPVLGPLWRVAYPSRFDRDALCCDIFIPSPQEPHTATRTRIVNVHLDSLPINPSHRPRQFSTVASFLPSAGHGLVAGDFNPVLDEDATLVESNGLTDVWTALHPGKPGNTWGTDGEQAFPPSRLDKVVLLGLQPYHIEVLEPKRLGEVFMEQHNDQASVDQSEFQKTQSSDVNLPLSDHQPLLCSFSLAG